MNRFLELADGCPPFGWVLSAVAIAVVAAALAVILPLAFVSGVLRNARDVAEMA